MGVRLILPLFKKSEDWTGEPSDFHGKGGPMTISLPTELHFIDIAAQQAAQDYGIPYKSDMNGIAPGSVSPTSMTIKNGVRCSAFTAYLKPVLNHKNLTLIT